MPKYNVALIVGGWSSEREVSLNSGRACEKALVQAGHSVHIIDPPADLPKLMDLVPELDAALILLHGRYGEDGRIQGLLDCLGLPYAGAGVAASVTAMDKIRAKRRFAEAGLDVTPQYLVQPDEEADPEAIMAAISLPLVVKPSQEGSTVGVSFIEDAKDLAPAVDSARRPCEPVLIEPLLEGVEVTAGVIELPGQGLTALPLVEIRPKTGRFFDYERKYTPGATEEICPATIDEELTAICQEGAKTAHRVLGLNHYSRTDFIIVDRVPYILETNTIPGMTEGSLFPKEVAAYGLTLAQTLERLIYLALRDRPKGEAKV